MQHTDAGHRRLAVLLLLVVGLLLASCATPSVPTPHTERVLTTDARSVDLLQWSHATGQQVKGFWSQTTIQSFGTQTATGAITGTQTGTRVSLHLGSMRWLGVLTSTGFQVSTPAARTWVAVDTHAADQVVAAFVASATVGDRLHQLSHLLSALPPDSDPSTPDFHVLGVRQELTTLQQHWDTVMQSPHRCQALATFLSSWPLPATVFQLPDPETSTLAQQVSALLQAQGLLEHRPLPTLPGLVAPWVIPSSRITQALQPARSLLARLHQRTQLDQQQLQVLLEQDQQLSHQVTQTQQVCPDHSQGGRAR